MKYIFSLLLSFCFCFTFAQETSEVYAKNNDENDQKVIEFGTALMNSFYDNDSTFFLDNFHTESFVAKVMQKDDETMKEDTLSAFDKSFMKGFLSKFKIFPENINKSIQNGTMYNIVNYYYHLDEKKYHLLFRMYSDEEGLNYHDYQLNYIDGDFKLQDMYVYTTGEYFSDTLGNIYRLSIPPEDSTDTEANRAQLKSLFFMTRYQSLINNEQFEKAFKLINNLEGSFREKKIYYIMKIQVASQINEVYHMEAIDELLKKFPDDPTTKLMGIDYFVMLKDYNATMQILDDLRAATEDDFVEYIRGNTAWEFKDYEGAEKAYSYIAKEYPEFEGAKLNLLYLYDTLERHEDNIVLLNMMIDSEMYAKKDLIDFIDNKENEFIHLPNAEIYNRWKEKK
ncbi:tetratricopeptide repeat protein [Kordia sp.]|uniref:tetratricopeptide repeat protein n=1 Tax=Kordia sp. TaxID=1965332 RepID=UPI003B5C6C33